MANLVIKKLSKHYGKTTAVDNINLEIKDREYFVLVGPSGCGKTTFLRLIAGLEKIQEGEIFLDGIKVNDIHPKDRDIAMVFQSYALYPHMKVYENIAFPLQMRKIGKEEIRKRVFDTADLLGISHLLDERPKKLSGGERQRVAVGRAIVRNPKLFLFDEPLSNLDIKLRSQMRAELKKIHEQLKATIIHVTHDQTEAVTLGERICVMRKGVVQQTGTHEELYNRPANIFVAGFIGSPPVNLLRTRIIKDGEGTWFVIDDLKLKANPGAARKLESFPGSEVILGIRPELILPPSLAAGAGNGSSLKVRTERVESFGADIHLNFTLGRIPLHARWFASLNEIKEGDFTEVFVDMDKAVIFNPETETAI